MIVKLFLLITMVYMLELPFLFLVLNLLVLQLSFLHKVIVYYFSSLLHFLCCLLLHVYFIPAGLELLLGLFESTAVKQQEDSTVALYKLAKKAASISPMDAAPPSPTPQVSLL